MRIIITDTGRIWNPDNPFLEAVKDIVLVVCLNGKKATDKYECFVSPFKQVGMGIDKYGTEDMKFKALASVGKKLNDKLHYNDDIVFLADSDVSTLYPFYVLKDLNHYNSFHLVAASPFDFDYRRLVAYSEMLSDLTSLSSFLYLDSNAFFDKNEKPAMKEVYKRIEDYFCKIMPTVLNGINDMKYKSGRCYFDFSSMSYIPLKNGFKDINLSNKDNIANELNFEPFRCLSTLGLVVPSSYPEDDEYIYEITESPVPRPDGKQICNILREQRLRVARANNIPFESEECPSRGPCAGTCAKCDEEADYLRKKLNKIPADQRIYPEFDLEKEGIVSGCAVKTNDQE